MGSVLLIALLFGTTVYLKYFGQKDANLNRGSLRLLGFGSATFLSLMLISWTQYEYLPKGFISDNLNIIVPDEMEIQENHSLEALPPPPTPVAPIIKPVDNFKEPEPVEPEPELPISPTPIEYTGPTDVNSTVTNVRPVVVIPEEAPRKPEEIFHVVEKMPRFVDCEECAGDKELEKKHSDKALLSFLYANIKYPALAKEMGVEGVVYVSFVVDKEGNVTNPKVLREPGAGLGEEAIRVVKLMHKWIPGFQRTTAVNVLYNLPVKFKLQ